MITGASDGIGKAYSIELAKEGFNICLLGRNKEKLQQAEKDVIEGNLKIQTKIIIADLAKSHDVKLFE